jgi:hypothetical protein
MKITKLPSFPPGDNPFNHDFFNMGIRVGKNIMIMMGNHAHEQCKYVILVNTETGKRILVDVDKE